MFIFFMYKLANKGNWIEIPDLSINIFLNLSLFKTLEKFETNPSLLQTFAAMFVRFVNI